ncbi:putative FAD-binding protein [Golovinomyces cichoracearum]|uniref:Putative FAD-binding protein n=1 Tax=Golovinomyces cichoracearum TaxID=62708 RepID=A0A420HUB0_9PEZI|nr:putative FAD-binding protein [Golovinomyces cichoracearum]
MEHPLPFRTKTTSHCTSKEPDVVDLPCLTSSAITTQSDAIKQSMPTQYHPESVDPVPQNVNDAQSLMDDPRTKLLKGCCGGNCFISNEKKVERNLEHVDQPDNEAYRSLKLNIKQIPTVLSGVPELPEQTVSILSVNPNIQSGYEESSTFPKSVQSTDTASNASTTEIPAVKTTDVAAKFYSKTDTTVHPPSFVQPHPPYNLYSARIFSARQLTQPGAVKRTYHFELDVSDYPAETGVDFKVGGAIGVSTPNESSVVENFLDLLCVPHSIRDRPILLKTKSGRWPTVWGDEMSREIITTRRDIITWCTDLQSYPPTKPLLRLLAQYAGLESEKRILLYLISDQGQSTFCQLRTGKYITIPQLLHAFPSCLPPLDALLSTLRQLMPRFYSLSNDPYDACVPDAFCKRLIEIAVTVREHPHWDGTKRTGVGSGFLERQAQAFFEAEKRGIKPDLRVPMFKGLMANPLAREFVSDGPMLLIGAGVGIAPFRGFVQRRLRNANCANKVWVIQGIRDSLLDELYGGEWGFLESEVKKVVQSRKTSGPRKYVQDEVRAQADLVWSIINSLDGRIFVCGSSDGMAQGVEKALIDVASLKGSLIEEDAKEFWELKKKEGQYIVEAWSYGEE